MPPSLPTRRFGRHRDAPPLPDLTGWHSRAYQRLLDTGLEETFREMFPIRSHDGRRGLYYGGFALGEPPLSRDDARRLGQSYARPVLLRLRTDGPEPIEQLVSVASLPVMLAPGEFLINGAPRIIIGLLARAPGIDLRSGATRGALIARIQPRRGPRVELVHTPGEGIEVQLGTRVSLPLFTLLRALAPEGPPAGLGTLAASGACEGASATPEEALRAVYRQVKKAPAPSLDRARQVVAELFAPPRYALGPEGRARLNRAFGPEHPVSLTEQSLLVADLVAAAGRLLAAARGEVELDDGDHLANRRVRLLDDLLVEELRRAAVKFRRGASDRLQKDVTRGVPSLPAEVARHRALHAAIEVFFSRGPLSQVADQLNPLARLAHARRLTAALPGDGRKRARFEARDVHASHHGRLCPVETPEGEAIGLVSHLALYAQADDNGFLTAPYRAVRDGRIASGPRWLRCDDEMGQWAAPADVPHDEGRLTADWVIARREGDFVSVPADQVQFLAGSPAQGVGVSAGLIPFLDHDDANRALMGANMQRQAVPLLWPEAPLVGTGLEGAVARQSPFVLRAEQDGTVTYLDADTVRVGARDYPLQKFQPIGGGCHNQRPLVRLGDTVRAGDVLADGAATVGGELALGRNLLVAFLSWEGHNFEDAIVLSQRLVRDGCLTSLHLEELEVELRDRGEQLTPAVPGVPARALVHLDENGLARVGARVLPGDVLVGKVRPRSRPETTPESALVRALLGEDDVENDSLEVPPGVEATVIAVEQDIAREHLPAGVRVRIRVVLATKRVISVGDKMAGRHGNKGVISKILPVEDMPYMADGTPVDILLNPLGVPSRMNVGQIFETHLGWAAAKLGFKAITPVFDGAEEQEIRKALREAGLPETGKSVLYDGRTGERFEQPVTVGYIYMLKLHHLVDDKVHARATGPYSLITQQPLGGKARFGGQRFGEMEVWALEAHGAAATLQEMMTLKSDDVEGRQQMYDALVAGTDLPEPGLPASVEVLRQELRGLGLDLRFEKSEDGTTNHTKDHEGRQRRGSEEKGETK